jgi:archaellum component FlaD/FlaE
VKDANGSLQEKPSSSNQRYCLSVGLQNRPTKHSTTIFTMLSMEKRHSLPLEAPMPESTMTEMISWRWLGPLKKIG